MFDEHSSSPRRIVWTPPVLSPPVPPQVVETHVSWKTSDVLLIVLLCGLCLLLGLTVVDTLAHQLMDVAWVASATAGSFVYCSVLLVILGVSLLRGYRLRDLGFRRTTRNWLAAGVGLGVIFLPIRLILVFFILIVFGGDLSEAALFGEPTESEEFSAWYFLGFIELLLMIGVFAPVVEELFFRGLLHSWLGQKIATIPAIIFTGFLFGLAHLDPLLVTSNIVLGFVLSATYHYSQSLWVSMLIHFVNNGIVLVMFGCLMVLVVLAGA